MTQPHTSQWAASTDSIAIYSAFQLATLVTLGVSAAILGFTLWLTGGHFSLSLDDPYIHLALSENLLTGHYGINTNEFSAPSSSALWPLIIAPLTLLPFADLGLWLFNLIVGVASLFIFSKLIDTKEAFGQPLRDRTMVFFLLLFALQANILGLAMVGMEHQLQVFLSVAIFYGMYQHLKYDRLPLWLGFAIIAAPLVRYESLAISAAALFYLFFTRRRFYAFALGVITLGGLVGFSIFLLSLGLDKFPDSVLVKSSTARGLANLFDNLWGNLHFPKSIALVFIMMLFLHTAWFKSIGKKHQVFYLSLAIAIGLHLLFGRTGWFFRYEIYIWVFAGCGGFCLFRQPLLPDEKPLWRRLSKGIMVLFVSVGSLEHVAALIATPVTASNIFYQQHQMATLVKTYIKAPVAVNDLGAVSFKNRHYVLDLWGLGSSDARKLRKAGGVDWMHKLAQQANVQLVMIYQTNNWFPDVPTQWIKIGELSDATFRLISPYPVSFFAIDQASFEQSQLKIQAWQKTLPQVVTFTWQRHESIARTSDVQGLADQ
ncbi:MAG: hypothetical protein OXE99_07060 [Cellvibrionales bacterium]|nr:hypothetical protein [Cellvibrionales bacterium]